MTTGVQIMTGAKKASGLTRRDFLSRSLAGGAVLAAGPLLAQASRPAAGARQGSPNILWICTDQQRYDTIAALSGNPLVRTANMDRLVNQGVAFTQAFTQSTVCTPSRASFLTSRYPHLTGAHGNGFDIRENELLISKIFADAGYHCGLVGKLHISSAQGHVERRIDDGYEEFMWSHDPLPNWPGANQYIEWLESKGHKWQDVYHRVKGQPAWAGVPVELHQTTWCFEQAMDFVSRNKSKPWFLSINVFAPHHPFDPSEKYRKRYDPEKMPDPLYQEGELENKPPNQTVDHNGAYGGIGIAFSKLTPAQRRLVTAAYYAMVEQTDDQLGRLLDHLDETGQRENTIIVFMSDHGEMLGNHGIYWKGHYPYEDLIHVPLILSWPGRFEAGLRSDALVELVDVAPTLLDATGQETPPCMQGRSLHGICTGEADPHEHRDYVFTECYEVTPNDDPPTYLTMIRDRRYKISVYHGQELGELYDLQEDRNEFTNLWNSAAHQELKHRLIKKCFDAQIATLDPMPERTGVY